MKFWKTHEKGSEMGRDCVPLTGEQWLWLYLSFHQLSWIDPQLFWVCVHVCNFCMHASILHTFIHMGQTHHCNPEGMLICWLLCVCVCILSGASPRGCLHTPTVTGWGPTGRKWCHLGCLGNTGMRYRVSLAGSQQVVVSSKTLWPGGQSRTSMSHHSSLTFKPWRHSVN